MYLDIILITYSKINIHAVQIKCLLVFTRLLFKMGHIRLNNNVQVFIIITILNKIYQFRQCWNRSQLTLIILIFRVIKQINILT